MKSYDVTAAINKHYGQGQYINMADLAKHLQNNRIDTFEQSPHKHDGFDKPFEEYLPCVIRYSDSVLIITQSDIVEAFI